MSDLWFVSPALCCFVPPGHQGACESVDHQQLSFWALSILFSRRKDVLVHAELSTCLPWLWQLQRLGTGGGLTALCPTPSAQVPAGPLLSTKSPADSCGVPPHQLHHVQAAGWGAQPQQQQMPC